MDNMFRVVQYRTESNKAYTHHKQYCVYTYTSFTSFSILCIHNLYHNYEIN